MQDPPPRGAEALLLAIAISPYRRLSRRDSAAGTGAWLNRAAVPPQRASGEREQRRRSEPASSPSDEYRWHECRAAPPAVMEQRPETPQSARYGAVTGRYGPLRAVTGLLRMPLAAHDTATAAAA